MATFCLGRAPPVCSRLTLEPAWCRCSAILACLFYLCLLFVRKEQGRRVNWWFCRTVSRPQGRTLIVKLVPARNISGPLRAAAAWGTSSSHVTTVFTQHSYRLRIDVLDGKRCYLGIRRVVREGLHPPSGSSECLLERARPRVIPPALTISIYSPEFRARSINGDHSFGFPSPLKVSPHFAHSASPPLAAQS